MWCDKMPFESLKGKMLSKIEGKTGDEEMIFTTEDGEVFKMFYEHDCCASCNIVDIAGDLEDLIGSPILFAEVVTNEGENPLGVEVPEYQDSFTWTFYKLSTLKGSVTISWYGESNGYYNESVTFTKI